MPDILGQSLVCDPEKDTLIQYLPDAGRFLEIGTWSGATAAYILDHRPGATALCLDTYTGGHGNSVPTSENLWAFTRNAWLRPGRMAMFLGDVTMLLRFSLRARFDLVFVDGDHSTVLAYIDLCAAADLCAPGGAIAIHDIIEGGDVIIALERFLAERPEWVEVERNNVTVLLRRRIDNDAP